MYITYKKRKQHSCFQLFRIIYEGSCDSEDGSNDAKDTRINDILKYIKIEFHIIAVLLYFWSSKCRLGEHKISKMFKNFWTIVYLQKNMFWLIM